MGGTIELPFGLATSIGSVPCDRPEDACELAMSANSSFPTVPVLAPHSSSLLAQAVHGIPGVEVQPPGLLRLHDPAVGDVPVGDVPVGAVADARAAAQALVAGELVGGDVDVEVSGGPFAATTGFLDHLAVESDGGGVLGVRVGLLGPVTLALSLRAAGVPVVHTLALAESVVARRAAVLLETTRAALPDAVVLVCASEPGLVGAMHPTFPLAPSEVVGTLGALVTTLDQHPDAGDLLIGVHVPGRTNWEAILATGVSVISTPADTGAVGWAPQLADFLDRGGRIAWGAVPVDQPLGTSEELLWRRLERAVVRAGGGGDGSAAAAQPEPDQPGGRPGSLRPHAGRTTARPGRRDLAARAAPGHRGTAVPRGLTLTRRRVDARRPGPGREARTCPSPAQKLDRSGH